MFKLFCVSSAWTNSGCTGSQTQQRCTFKAASVLLQLLCQAFQFHWPSWFYWLMGVSRKSDNNSRCNVAYRRFFFYHLLDHGPLYTRITDDRLVKPHHSMFLQRSLMFSLCYVSNLMHQSHVCLCYKSNIFPQFDSQIGTALKVCP